MFGVYGNVMRVLSEGREQERPSFKNTMIASVAVAFAQSLIICPMELVKCRLQVQTNSSNRLYKGIRRFVVAIHFPTTLMGLFYPQQLSYNENLFHEFKVFYEDWGYNVFLILYRFIFCSLCRDFSYWFLLNSLSERPGAARRLEELK